MNDCHLNVSPVTILILILNLVLVYLNVLFCNLEAFYEIKVVNSINIEHNLLKNDQSDDARNNRSKHFVSQ